MYKHGCDSPCLIFHAMRHPLRVWAASALWLACAAASASASAAPFVYLTNWYAQAEHGGFYQAQAQGLYKQAGLEDLVGLDGAELADGAIDRAHQAGLGQGAGTGLQGAGEEFVEGGVAGRVGVGRLLHVHAIAPNEPFNEACGEGPAANIGGMASRGRQGHLGQHILRSYEQALRHRHPTGRNGKTAKEAPFYGGRCTNTAAIHPA